jgi:hypothetical protein
VSPHLTTENCGDKLGDDSKLGRDSGLRHALCSHGEDAWDVGFSQLPLVEGTSAAKPVSLPACESVGYVNLVVLGYFQRLKILWSVVVPDVIDVVNLFVWGEIATQLCLKHENGSLDAFRATRRAPAARCSWMSFWGWHEHVAGGVSFYAALPSGAIGAVSRRLRQPVSGQAVAPLPVIPTRDNATTSAATQRRWSIWLAPFGHSQNLTTISAIYWESMAMMRTPLPLVQLRK